MADDLDHWLVTRETLSNHSATEMACTPTIGIRDGHEHFITTMIAPQDEQKAAHWRSALACCRLEASGDGQLTWQRLAGWNALVRALPAGTPTPALRRTVAYAKGGRERYGVPSDFIERFRLALTQSDDLSIPVTIRAARVYLDVAFFHPFADGNARCAALALDFVLAREGVILDQLAPVLLVPRWADDPLVGVHLADLLELLVVATRKRQPGAMPSPTGRT